MKIYGTGSFVAPWSSRVIWDFKDGPFDTVNPTLLESARKQGYSFKPLPEPEVVPKPEVIPKKKPGRPAGTGKKGKK